MRLTTLTAGTVLVAALAMPAAAQDPTGFLGKWKLDPVRSIGQVFAPPVNRPTPPPGSRPRARRGGSPANSPPAVRSAAQSPVEQTLSVKLDKGVLQVDQETGGSKQTVKYAMDGSETTIRQYLPPLEAPEEFKVTARWDGAKLVVEGTGEAEILESPVQVRVTETRWTEENGTIMIVESLVQIPGRPNTARRLVYIRE